MSTKRSRIMVIICSTRPGALGPAIGEWFIDAVAPLADTLGVELRPVSLLDLNLPLLDEEEHPSSGVYHQQHTREWSAMVDAADGFIAVTPEYNYGMPASLKNALDYLGREWAWKPIGFVSYGNTSAGTRSVQHAKQVISTLRLVPLGSTVAIRIADNVEDGRVRRNHQMSAAAFGMLNELARLGHALRPMRESMHPMASTGPLPGSYVRRLTEEDAPEVTVLQRSCWVDEAIANETLEISALHESLDEVRAGLKEWNVTGLWRDGRLLGMVRARRQGDNWNIGRLAVVPDLRGTGMGRWLLQYAEADAEPGCTIAELFTGARSAENIRLYLSAGFELASAADDGVVHLTKRLPSESLTVAT